jgi:hypothetical protein
MCLAWLIYDICGIRKRRDLLTDKDWEAIKYQFYNSEPAPLDSVSESYMKVTDKEARLLEQMPYDSGNFVR